MKNLIFLSFILLSLTACNSKSSKTENTTPTESQKTETVADTTAETKPVAQLYSCPMHPEVKGAKGSKCPKCGMAVTEPVK